MCTATACEKPVPVIFRADKSDGQIIAVLPTIPAGGNRVTIYSHVGQHSACSIGWYREKTRPASNEEAAQLRRELEAAPYRYRFSIRHRLPAFGHWQDHG